ncbi:class I SAM-dependent methyltransferase [Halosegnis sp.]|uniref:class I SAM-dependent methyltransferase n=1 Tax=Halosegnis sp. TaxID=2864959 RepID=UPI0035D44F72
MTHDTHQPWEGRTGEFSPTYYAYKGANGTSETLRDLLVARVGRDASVLEVGCNVGRHLAYLHDAGFTDLTGVDINPAAVTKLQETHPSLAAAGQFRVGDIAAVAGQLPAGAFDVVYSVESLQHVPDDGRVFDDVARAAGDLLVTVENERAAPAKSTVESPDGDLSIYHRDWHEIFTSRGLGAVAVADEGRDMLRAFAPETSRRLTG